MTRDEFKIRQLDVLHRLRGEFTETIALIESWNNERTDEEPVDCGSERVLVAMADRAITAIWGDRLDEYRDIVDDMKLQIEKTCEADDE